jgi:hypothetical protein
VAAQFPQAKLVVAPATGHSALGSDLSGCAERAFARFFRDQPVPDRCPHHRREFPPSPPPPRSLGGVEPATGTSGLRGRALRAVALTLRDVSEDSVTHFILDERDPDIARGGGLRGGRYRIDGNAHLHLSDVVFVPRVRVSGLVRRFGGRRQSGRLRVSGEVEGVLSLRGRRLSGRLAGKRIRAVATATGSATATVARLRAPAGR